jgi:hypothetical protein
MPIAKQTPAPCAYTRCTDSDAFPTAFPKACMNENVPKHRTSPKTKMLARTLELPVFVNRLDGPIELLAQRLGEELLNGDVELLGEDNGETRIDVVLKKS